MPEIVRGYPDRILPKNEAAAAELKKRTLTNLYNQRPQWLADAHLNFNPPLPAPFGCPPKIPNKNPLASWFTPNSISRAERRGRA